MSAYMRTCPADDQGVLSRFFQAPFPVTVAPAGVPSGSFDCLVSSALAAVPFPRVGLSAGGRKVRDKRLISSCRSPEETHAAFETVFEATMQRYLDECQ
ncbi:MAG: hypothetical protein AAFU72_00045 [Pseudomonadota bacterium]